MSLSGGVDCSTKTGEELGPALSLIEDEQLTTGGEEIPLQVEAHAIGFLLQVEVLAAEAARQGGLAALARADHRDRGEGAKPLLEKWCRGPITHACRLESDC